MAVAGSALIRRRLRQRFGIAAKKVSIRSEVPWYWRALLWVIILSTSLALAAWMYETGRRFAGFNRSETDQELASLQAQVRSLEGELEKLRAVAHSSDSRLQVETTTQDQLAMQIKALHRDNAALKEDVALFEGLVAGGAQTGGPRIARVTVEPAGNDGRWRYRVLVVNPALVKGAREIRGELQFELTVRQNGKDVSISVPSQGADAAGFQFSVKHFQRVEGEFSVPRGADLKAGEVRLIYEGAVKARQSVIL